MYTQKSHHIIDYCVWHRGTSSATNNTAATMASAAIIDGLVKRFPGRYEQISQLITLMGTPELPTLPSLFVYGTTATGKSTVVQSVLEATQVPFAMVSCIETYTPRLLYEQVLNALSGELPGAPNLYTGYARCDSMRAFLPLLAEVIDKRACPHHTTYIVLDDCDRLRSMNPAILAAFLRLSELVKRNVCVICISCIIWDKFAHGTGFNDPLLVHFPPYNKSQTVQIVTLQCPEGVEEAAFSRFVALMYDVFHGPCRDVAEMQHLVSLFFDIYYDPVDKGLVASTNTAALYRHIMPLLKRHLSKLHLRETSTCEWKDILKQYQAKQHRLHAQDTLASTEVDTSADKHGKFEGGDGADADADAGGKEKDKAEPPHRQQRALATSAKRLSSHSDQGMKSGMGDGDGPDPRPNVKKAGGSEQNPSKLSLVKPKAQVSMKLELPFHAKFLLIAGYLASYIPQRFDTSLYLKRASAGSRRKGSRRGHSAGQSAKQSQQTTGPKSVTLDRLLAIFFSISGEENATSELYSHVKSLVSLHLLTQVSADDNLDAPRFKCNISLPEVQLLGASVDFDVMAMLSD
eukprot:m.192208 g.192208  ORF g.192208 m.192208 type:complete len:575 (+) comp14851_c1_seq5:895-2619(+)